MRGVLLLLVTAAFLATAGCDKRIHDVRGPDRPLLRALT